MSKDEFMSYLVKNGYKPIRENGCVMIVTENKKDIEKLSELADKGGYVGSYGWRMKRKEEAKPKVQLGDDSAEETTEFEMTD